MLNIVFIIKFLIKSDKERAKEQFLSSFNVEKMELFKFLLLDSITKNNNISRTVLIVLILLWQVFVSNYKFPWVKYKMSE